MAISEGHFQSLYLLMFTSFNCTIFFMESRTQDFPNWNNHNKMTNYGLTRRKFFVQAEIKP